jgi:hypothetical protein
MHRPEKPLTFRKNPASQESPGPPADRPHRAGGFCHSERVMASLRFRQSAI